MCVVVCCQPLLESAMGWCQLVLQCAWRYWVLVILVTLTWEQPHDVNCNQRMRTADGACCTCCRWCLHLSLP